MPHQQASRDAQLRGRSISGGTAMLAVQGGRFALNMLAMAVLARLLVPDDFGLLAMAVTATSLLGMFRDMGLSAATVQHPTLSREQISALFWIILGLSLGMALLTALAAPAVAWFYGDPRLGLLLPVLSLEFVCRGLGAQPMALLRRRLRFVALALLETIAMLGGIAVAILMALRGWGYWALAGRILVEQAVLAAGVWLAGNWRPDLPRRGAEVGPLLHFGGHLAGANILLYFVRQFDNVLLGWRWGQGPLAFYEKAYQLLYLPIQQIINPLSGVAVPILSRLQDDPEGFRRYYGKGLMLAAAMSMPLVCLCVVSADKIIWIALGDQWGAAVELFRFLGPAAFMGTINIAGGWVYLALGRTDRQLRWQLVGSSVMMAAFVVGVQWGAAGIALAFSLTTVLLRYPSLAYCFRGTFIRMRDLVQAVWRPAAASVGAGAWTWGMGMLVWPAATPVLGLAMDVGLYLSGYAGLWLMLPGGRQRVGEVIGLLRELRNAKG